MKKTVASLILLGIVPLTSLSLAACTNRASAPSSEANSPRDSSMAQMDHGSMSSPSASPMPMDHSSGMMSMDLGPADESFDLRFIDAMILHHKGAIAMAEEALEKSNREEVKTLAQDIISAQQQEIAQLTEWRQAWYPDAGSEPMMYHTQMNSMMPMSEEMQSSMMMMGNLGGADDQFDLRFINAMIPHHEGALTMAQEASEKSDRSEIKELAQNIIDSQQQEIDQMEQWRKDWYGQ